ncbi:Hypothetical predicted protein [Marmota monax]|uniref:PHD finger protein 10 n=1 Tax=Marmota monax TaxID=9995 RepID=A0A5E4CXH4_MARMO|nr:Hypothetical predicted protein [Marmota monax]
MAVALAGRGARGGRGRPPGGRAEGAGPGRRAARAAAAAAAAAAAGTKRRRRRRRRRGALGLMAAAAGPGAALSPRPCDSDPATPGAQSPKEDNEDNSNDGTQPSKRRRMGSGDSSRSCETSSQDLGFSYYPAENLIEYKWPPDETGEYYMLQEQVSEYLGVTSFKRKYPDLERRDLSHKEKLYLRELNVITETQCTLGLTALRSDEVIDLMIKEYPAKHAEYSVILQEKERQRITDHYKEYSQMQQQNTQKVEASKVPEYIKKAAKKAAEFNSNLNRERMEERRAYFDLQTHVIQVPQGKYRVLPTERTKVSSYPVALIPGQFQEYYKRYSPDELRYLPLNTALYEPPLDPELPALDSDGDSDDGEDGRGDEKRKNKGTSEEAAIKGLFRLAEGYSSRCHPAFQLKKQVLSCGKSIGSWPLLPFPEDLSREAARLEGNSEANACNSLITKILHELFHHMPEDHLAFRDLVGPPTGKWPQLLAELCNIHIPTLFCPRGVLEVLVVLRSISAQCQRVSSQVTTSLQLRHRQWGERRLRSRQRQNYVRMLNRCGHCCPAGGSWAGSPSGHGIVRKVLQRTKSMGAEQRLWALTGLCWSSPAQRLRRGRATAVSVQLLGREGLVRGHGGQEGCMKGPPSLTTTGRAWCRGWAHSVWKRIF